MLGGHAAVDRAASHNAADCSSCCAKQPAAYHLAANHCTGNTAGDLAGRSRRMAAIPMRIVGFTVIGVMVRIVSAVRCSRGRDGTALVATTDAAVIILISFFIFDSLSCPFRDYNELL